MPCDVAQRSSDAPVFRVVDRLMREGKLEALDHTTSSGVTG